MTAAGAPLREIRQALADDLDMLARVHDRELDAPLIASLCEVGFPRNLALVPESAPVEALHTLLSGWAGDGFRLQKIGGVAACDLLAADFAGIYLTGACGASPYESVWLTDEHLTCQQPMFELRALYQAAGLAVGDWRQRYDDHFVLQFQYLAHRLRDEAVELPELGRFCDEHVGLWFPDFVRTVVQRADSDFYRLLVLLTAAWLEDFRALLEEMTGETRPPREAIAERRRKQLALAAGELAPIRFMPGGRPDAGPSW